MLKLAEADLHELRRYVQPPAVIADVLAAVCIVLGCSTDWNSAVIVLNDSEQPFLSRIKGFDLASLRPGRAAQLTQALQSQHLMFERVQAVSAAASSLAQWVHAVHQHAQIDSVISRQRATTNELLANQEVMQARIMLDMAHS